MSTKFDKQGPVILATNGKGPWDSPDSGETGGANNPTGPRGGSKADPVNPWDPTPEPGGRGRSRGPSLEELLRRKGGGLVDWRNVPTEKAGSR